MAFSSDIPVLMLVLGAPPLASLVRVALRCGWPLQRILSAGQGIGLVRTCRPHVVVVQVSVQQGDALELIRRARAGTLSLSVVAVAASDEPPTEQSIRAAGAHCYFAADTAPELLEQSIFRLLVPSGDGAATTGSSDTAA